MSSRRLSEPQASRNQDDRSRSNNPGFASASGFAQPTKIAQSTEFSRRELSRWLAAHTRQLLSPLVISVFARIIGQLLGVALFAIAAHAIATASPANGASISVTIWILVALALGKAGLRYLEHYAGHWVAFTSLQRLRELFFARLIPQVPAATSGRAGAELTSRATTDIDRIEVFFAHTFPPAVAAVAVPAVALTWLGITVSAPLALTLAAFLIAATIALPLLTSRGTWRRAGLVARQRGDLARRIGDDVQGVREVLAFGIEDARLDGLADVDSELLRERSRSGRQHGSRAVVTLLLQLGGLGTVAAVGIATGASAVAIAVSLAVGIALWAPVQGIDGFASGLDAAFAATGRIREIIDGEPSVTDGPGVNASNGSRIAVDNVSFGYGSRPTLDNVTARFTACEWSYVVGVSGSGKSTLARLIVRGWDVSAGAIRLGGADVRELTLSDLRGRVALVSQRPTMLSGTIAENLRLAATDASDADLREALTAVGLEGWVDSLPKGLDSPIAERGLDISGGQLQRLALARALVAKPEVLVLDEALSQLDADTALTVRERVGQWSGGVTVVELTHRADLVPDSANVVVLDSGRVAESGTAQELRVLRGPFTQLEARH